MPTLPILRTSHRLTADATNIELPDGSVITGQTTFTYGDGTTGTVADATLVAEGQGYRVEETLSIDGSGTRTVTKTGYGADGAVAFVDTSVTTSDGTSITNSYDVNGDGVVDRLQTIVTATDAGGVRAGMNRAVAGNVDAWILPLPQTTIARLVA
jgi:hypothetical protein